MNVEDFVKTTNVDFFTGVPDSQLKALCNYLINKYGTDGIHHVIASNEGCCTGIAAGYHLATNKVPMVYLQNSGEGNIINPVASLLNENIYAIPTIFTIGWRGEPGVKDEPQHIFQGQITLKLLDTLNIKYFIIRKDTSLDELNSVMSRFNNILKDGKQVAFVVCAGALENPPEVKYTNSNTILREELINHLLNVTDQDVIISTTGKASRELFEMRESKKQSHKYDFLTVGSMGHCSSIALGIALQKPEKKIWILDGDGAALMHMGAIATIGHFKPSNVVHIIVNNESHESVGGQPTIMGDVDLVSIAKSCGYQNATSIQSIEDLDEKLIQAKTLSKLSLIEIKCAIGSRKNLGRPTHTPKDNKNSFMSYLHG
jgi:phosphonopyruvate decarboxylase